MKSRKMMRITKKRDPFFEIFIDDLARTIFDILKLFCYFLAGVVIVNGTMYAIMGLFNLIIRN